MEEKSLEGAWSLWEVVRGEVVRVEEKSLEGAWSNLGSR